MSLVNDMLRDLDRRRQLPKEANRVTAAIPVRVEAGKPKYWFFIVLVLAGIVIGILAGLYFSQRDTTVEFPLADTAGNQLPAGTLPVPEPVVTQQEPAEEAQDETERESFAELELAEPEVVEPELAEPEIVETEIVETGIVETETSVEEAEEPDEELAVKESEIAGEAADKTANVAEISETETPPTRVTRELSMEERDSNAARRAIDTINSGLLFEGLDILINYVADNPQAHQSRTTLATLMFARQEYEQAELIIDQGLSLAPNYAPYKKLKARLLNIAGNVGEATRLLSTLPPDIGEDVEYFELLASFYQQENRHLQAIQTYQELLRHDRQRGNWWAGLAISHEALGNIDEAVSGYQAALRQPDLDANLRQYSQNRVRNLGQ